MYYLFLLILKEATGSSHLTLPWTKLFCFTTDKFWRRKSWWTWIPPLWLVVGGEVNSKTQGLICCVFLLPSPL